MLRLYGFPISNYYNRIKMALKIKGLPFTEGRAAPSQETDYLQRNPLGVIPTLEIDGLFLAETQPILEYLEERFPETRRLLPQNPVERHRVRQIINYIDVHIDKPIRLLRDAEKLGTQPALREVVKNEVLRAVSALNAIALFNPYIAGHEITFADCAAYCTLPWFDLLAERHLGERLLGPLQGFMPYRNFLDQNPDFAEIHKTAEKQLAVLERARRMAAAQNP
ncbi:MAG: glutathione S-transferase family protein [Turneriella sp.]|nr:glutathione S-transferase family protein [Turneriella sp.]